MACDTFLKISKQCKEKFVITHQVCVFLFMYLFVLFFFALLCFALLFLKTESQNLGRGTIY